MSHARVRNLFQTALNTYAKNKGIRVAFDNVQFTPTTNETYLVSHLMPASTNSGTLSGDHKAFVGVYQITIVSPSGRATSKSDEISAELQQEFTVYKRYTESGSLSDPLTVTVMSPLHTPEGKVQNGGWIVPCYFDYRADTN